MNRQTPLLVKIMGTAAGAFAGYFAVEKAFDHFRAPAEVRTWHSHNLAGVVLEAPGDFKITPVDFGPAKEFIESSEMQENKVTGFEIAVVRNVYKDGIELNFDGAVQGSVNSIKQLDGVTNMEHTATEQTVSGKTARHLSAKFARWQRTIRLEAVLIADGQTYYHMQVIFDSARPHGAEDAERLLKSVRLAP